MDFWFGCAASNTRKRKQRPYGPSQAISHLAEARGAINEWISKHGVRRTGEIGDLICNKDASYNDDGTIVDGYDPFEDGIESDSEIDAI